ncbi:MAG: ABC transporter ATP-binding protein [Clostridium sp.]
MNKIIISVKNLSKTFGDNESKTNALKGVNFSINKGELVVILGPSGSGKTTLLNLLSGLDSPNGGEIIVNGKNISKFKEGKLNSFRRDNVAFIFQSYYLLNNLNILDNVRLGAHLSSKKENINKIIRDVGLEEHKSKFPGQLSGGQKQRVAIARALAKNPSILFCDEPTGALDEETGKQVLMLLQNLNEKYNTTIIMVTHNPGIAEMADKVIKMNSGKIVEMIDNNNPVEAMEVKWA